MIPMKDSTTLGTILLHMGAITQEQLDTAAAEHKKLPRDAILGKLLVAKGFCTEEQYKIAIAAQKSIRSEDKAHSALAVADISIRRSRNKKTLATQERLRQKGEKLAKSVSNTGYEVITSVMLAASKAK